MKILTLLITILFVAITTQAQLNENANKIKEKSPNMYKDIKTFVSQKWAGDHEMMVYGINQQADAVFEMADLREKSDYDDEIFSKAFDKWSVLIDDKYVIDNVMLVYTYKKQLKAKSQY